MGARHDLDMPHQTTSEPTEQTLIAMMEVAYNDEFWSTRLSLQSYTLYVVVALSLLWALGTEGAGGPSPPTTEASSELQEPLVPLPLTLTVDPARAALGEQLFQDVRLFGQNTVACATCHQLALGGADGISKP
jgi:cytochrome c peroxidase